MWAASPDERPEDPHGVPVGHLQPSKSLTGVRTGGCHRCEASPSSDDESSARRTSHGPRSPSSLAANFHVFCLFVCFAPLLSFPSPLCLYVGGCICLHAVGKVPSSTFPVACTSPEEDQVISPPATDGSSSEAGSLRLEKLFSGCQIAVSTRPSPFLKPDQHVCARGPQTQYQWKLQRGGAAQNCYICSHFSTINCLTFYTVFCKFL